MTRLVTRVFWRLLTISGIVFCTLTWRVMAQFPAATQTTGSATGLPEQPNVLYEEAQRDFAKGDYVSAAKKYERLVSLQPDSASALNNLGVCYHLQGGVREAVQTLHRAIELNPDLLPANLILGIDYVQLNKAEQAIPYLERVLRSDRTNRDAIFALASAQIALGRFDQAAGVYRREVEVRPGDSDAWYGLGLCFEHLAEDTTRRMAESGKDSPYTQRLVGEFLTEQDAGIDAEEAFQRALASGGDQEGLHASLGFAYLRLGEVLQADKEFNAERQLHPGHLDAKLGLADVAMERNDFAQARRLLCEVYGTDKAYFESRLNFLLASLDSQAQSKAVDELKPDSSATGCARALDAVQKVLTSPQSSGQLKDAFESATIARARTSPVSPPAAAASQAANQAGHYTECFEALRSKLTLSKENTLLFATCACLSGHFFLGFEAARSVLEHDPQNMPALYWQAEAARKLAQAAFQQSVSLSPNSWQGHILLGDIFRQRKQWDQAISHYQEAARLKPASPAPFLGLGTVYWQTGRNHQAEAALREALTVQPDNALAEFELGDIYVREHRFEEAAPLLEKSIGRSTDLVSSHADLGKAYASLGRKKEAIAELQRALAMDRFGDIHYQLYRLYKEEGDARLAQEALAKSERLRALELQRHRERTERAAEIQKQANQP
jgi:tetratricopeptide (TPR) repeat protein